MIEFKAECGHTVRAKDDESGGSVRCSYCGRMASIPSSQDGPLDSLFDEVADASHPAAAAGTAGGRSRGAVRRRRRTGAFNPFPLILRLCYAALLICIVIVVVRRFILPLWNQPSHSPPVAQGGEGAPVKKRTGGDPAPPKPADKGLLERKLLEGLYVASTPPGAKVYCVNASAAPAVGRIHRLNGCSVFTAPTAIPRLADGSYVIELEFPWSHPELTRYAGYKEFRRKIETAPEAQRQQLVNEYFIPDEATAVFFDKTDEQQFIVRQYRGIDVRDGRSGVGVRGLFLPQVGAESGRFSIEALVASYLPEKEQYGIVENHVRDELEFYGVPESDREWLLRGLLRVGVMPYVTPDKRAHMFKIGIVDGMLNRKEIRESGK